MDERTPGASRSPAARPRTPFDAGELALVEHLRRRAGSLPPAAALRKGIGDDCAILRPRAGDEVVVTTDFSLEGRHFRRDWHAPDAIGHRILARGLSDLAAMGAEPMAAFLSLAVSRSIGKDAAWLDRVFDGLLALAKATGTPLAGGDTAESPSDHMLADIVLLGQVPQGRALQRDTGRPGDRLFVTGFLGGSAAELARISDPELRRGMAAPEPSATEPNPHPHLFPTPRLVQGVALRPIANACMDLSDGLSSDLHRLCGASGVRAVIHAARLPIHPLARLHGERALKLALDGGEDYELLFSAPADVEVPAEIAGVALTEIGALLPRVRGRSTVTLVGMDNRQHTLRAGGWEHLR